MIVFGKEKKVRKILICLLKVRFYFRLWEGSFSEMRFRKSKDSKIERKKEQSTLGFQFSSTCFNPFPINSDHNLLRICEIPRLISTPLFFLLFSSSSTGRECYMELHLWLRLLLWFSLFARHLGREPNVIYY